MVEHVHRIWETPEGEGGMTAVLMLLSAMGGALIATVILCACVAAGRKGEEK